MIPFGFLLPVLMKNKHKYLLTLFLAFLLILFIEIMQMVMQCGTFEVDDVVNNMLGTAIGLLLYRLISAVYHKSKS
jgi:glycopeptide antibiotics resistance protein